MGYGSDLNNSECWMVNGHFEYFKREWQFLRPCSSARPYTRKSKRNYSLIWV